MNTSLSHSILYIILNLCLLSCQKRIAHDFERTTISVNNQEFEVLTAWQIFDAYLATKPDYKKNIFNKIKDEFSHNTEYPFLYNAMEGTIEPNEELREVLELMRSIDFVAIVDSTYQQVTSELPGPDTKILFIPANPAYREIYKEIGIAFHAFTLGAGKIVVSFDPTFENWHQFLPYALAHEYHHSVWTSRNFETAELTPLEYIVFEGRADSFANELLPNTHHPFINILDANDRERIWALIEHEMNNRKTDINDKLYYGANDIPYGSVYALGFHIVEAYKRNNPSITDRELIDISPESILKQSHCFD